MANNHIAVNCNETVYNFFPGDSRFVSHAEMSVKNASDTVAEIEIPGCTFVANDKATPLDSFHVYSGGAEVGQHLRLLPLTEMHLSVTFPQQSVGVPQAQYFLQVELLVDGQTSKYRCPISVYLEYSS